MRARCPARAFGLEPSFAMRYRHFTYRYTTLLLGDDDERSGAVGGGDRSIVPFTHFRPHFDMAEAPGAFVITVEIAGVDETSLEVTVYDDALVIQGERALDPAPGQDVWFHRVEIARGPFKLELALPSNAVDRDHVRARYESGLLRVVIPKIRTEAQ